MPALCATGISWHLAMWSHARRIIASLLKVTCPALSHPLRWLMALQGDGSFPCTE